MIGEGIHSITMSDYLSDPAPEPSASRGCIIDCCELSPQLAWYNHPRSGQSSRRSSNRADAGSVMHALIMGLDHEIMVLDFPDWRTKAAKEAKAGAYSLGLVPMLYHKLRPLQDAAEVAKPIVNRLAQDVQWEQTLIWQDGESGAWCRSRPDGIDHSNRVVISYKTTGSDDKPGAADPVSWTRKVCYPSGYDVQAALELRGIEHLTGQTGWQYLWVVQEIAPPYAVSVIGLSNLARELADRKIDRGLGIFKRCLDANYWPGYDCGESGSFYLIEPPAWAAYELEDRELIGGWR